MTIIYLTSAREILLNNNLAPDEVLIVDANRIEIKPLQGRDFAHTYMGAKGDYVEGQIVGEFTLKLEQKKRTLALKGLK